MNVTKLCGWIVILFAAGYFIVALTDFGADYAAGGEIGERAERAQAQDEEGLKTSGGNLHFHVGVELLVDMLTIAVIVIAGWWLTTCEVQQYVWIGLTALLVIAAIAVRATPIVPLHIARYSAGGAFYGAQVLVPVGADVSAKYVNITKKQKRRIVVTLKGPQQPGGLAVIDFSQGDTANQYMSGSVPLTVLGTVGGTAHIAWENQVRSVPLINAKSVQAGMPKK